MSAESEQVDSIIVVGGGDAGLLTALALEKALNDPEISIIDDSKQSVPEVGKSTLSSVAYFLHNLVDIDMVRLISNVKLSWKTTVFFKDWCGVKPFHSPLGQSLPAVSHGQRDVNASHDFSEVLTPTHEAEFHEFYYRYNQVDFSTIYGEVAETPGKAPVRIIRSSEGQERLDVALPSVSYQFDSRSFNTFLRTVCLERGINIIDDRVTDVKKSGDWIESIQGEATDYAGELFVDASGFKRVLMRELDNPFLEFDLPVDSAVVATVDIPLSEVVSATVVTTGDSGWFWHIDTCGGMFGTRDLGYVYSSAHISDNAAEEEFIESRSEDINPASFRHYRFESGVLEQPWIANCVAMGNSLGFVEPLQSTALSATCELAERLARGLANHSRINHQGLRELFNGSTRSTWQEIYEFISIYYKYSSGTTSFWEEARDINPEPIQQYQSYQQSGFSGWRDIARLTRTQTDLNGIDLYYLSLRNLGVDSQFYENLDLEVDAQVVDQIDAHSASLSSRVDEFATYEDIWLP